MERCDSGKLGATRACRQPSSGGGGGSWVAEFMPSVANRDAAEDGDVGCGAGQTEVRSAVELEVGVDGVSQAAIETKDMPTLAGG